MWPIQRSLKAEVDIRDVHCITMLKSPTEVQVQRNLGRSRCSGPVKASITSELTSKLVSFMIERWKV